ncbi:hypothetical protein T484DRAFT_1827871 [Baffinella frigidus]|nr:hypothetical protein T484DRAFT_1827871 [Cryptophyta sp. CCMP2293]
MLSSWRTAGAASLLLAAALPLADAFSLAPSLQSRLAPPSALRGGYIPPLVRARIEAKSAVLPRSRKTRTPSGALALTASSAIPPKNLEPSDGFYD